MFLLLNIPISSTLSLPVFFVCLNMQALLEIEHGSQAIKQRGLSVIRAIVTKSSALVGKTVGQVDFRKTYKAAIVAVQKGGRNVNLSSLIFGTGDVLVLQASDDSPLLKAPPTNFYTDLANHHNHNNKDSNMNNTNKDATTMSKSNSVVSFVKAMARTRSSVSVEHRQPATTPSSQQQQQDQDEQDIETGLSGLDMPSIDQKKKGKKATGDDKNDTMDLPITTMASYDDYYIPSGDDDSISGNNDNDTDKLLFAGSNDGRDNDHDDDRDIDNDDDNNPSNRIMITDMVRLKETFARVFCCVCVFFLPSSLTHKPNTVFPVFCSPSCFSSSSSVLKN